MVRTSTVLCLLAVAACSTEVSSVEQANTQQCATQVVEGVDVYAGDGTIDWAKVKASGRAYAFIKATQGNYNKQSTFAANWTNSAANGILRSAYHYFDPTIDGVTQAQWFLDELTSVGGMTAADLPPMLDIECPVSSNQATAQSQGPNCERAGNSGWVATATMQQRIFDWLGTVEAATGRKAIIYSYPSWFPDVQFTDPKLTMYPLFIASYATCANVPPPWQKAVFWQYSATTTVPGIASPGDVDRFFGSAGDLATWNGSTVPDAGVSPGVDAGFGEQGDAGTGTAANAGCGCRTDARGSSWTFVLGLVIVVGRLRRRR